MKILFCEPEIFTTSGNHDTVSLLTDSSVSRNGLPLFLPPHHDRWTLTVSPALRISRLGKFISAKFAHRYYDAWTLVARLRPVGVLLPASATEIAFDSSIIIGNWIECDDIPSTFSIEGSGNKTIETTSCNVNDTLSRLSGYFMIKHGDVIVPATSFLSLPVIADTRISLNCNSHECLSFKIK